MNYFDQNSTLEGEISNFLFFRPQNRLQLSTYWLNVKKNPIFGILVKQCIQLMFPFEKFKNRRKSTYYSSEKFCFLAMSWISFLIQLSYPEFDGDHENVNYFDQNSTLEGEISNFLFFRPQNRLQLSTYWLNVKKNPIFGILVKQCIQLMFPFEKFKNRRKSTYYSSEKFSFLAKSWILIKTRLSLPEFDGDHEKMNDFIQNLILEGEFSIFLFFNF